MLQFLAALGIAAVFVTVVLVLLHLAFLADASRSDGAIDDAGRERRGP